MTLQDRLDAFKADFEGGKLAFKSGPKRSTSCIAPLLS